MKLTVLFDDPYWVAIVETLEGEQLKAYRYVFGAEPSAQQVMEFVQLQVPYCMRHVQPITAEYRQVEIRNPKRRQREAAREMQSRGISIKAQAAIQTDLETRKQDRRVVSKARREVQEDYKRQLARAKAKPSTEDTKAERSRG